MNADRAWLASLASQTTTESERRWYLRRQIQIARDVVLGATLKAAGTRSAVKAERARQILKMVHWKALQLPNGSTAPVEDWSTASMREHSEWWCARLDELAMVWDVAGDGENLSSRGDDG